MKRMWPSYYEGFQCLAQECPLTCCSGMEISIDKETYEKYMKVEGKLGRRLKREIDRGSLTFYQDEWGCMFLSKEGLCQIQSQLGSELLCDTCRKYPRHEEEYPSSLEYSLGLSCPEAGRLILSSGYQTRYFSEESEEEDEFSYEDGEELDYLSLCQVRERLFELVYDPQKSLEEKRGLLRACGELLQEAMDETLEEPGGAQGCEAGQEPGTAPEESLQEEGELLEEGFLREEELETLLQRARERVLSPKKSLLEEEPDFVLSRKADEITNTALEPSQQVETGFLEEEREVLFLIRRMDIPELTSLLKKLEEVIGEGEEAALKRDRAYREAMEQWGESFSYQEAVSALMGYYLYLYLAGACYDKQVNAAIRLGLFLTRAMESLGKALMAKRGRAPALEDLCLILAAISRQVEHDDETLLFLIHRFERSEQESP